MKKSKNRSKKKIKEFFVYYPRLRIIEGADWQLRLCRENSRALFALDELLANGYSFQYTIPQIKPGDTVKFLQQFDSERPHKSKRYQVQSINGKTATITALGHTKPYRVAIKKITAVNG